MMTFDLTENETGAALALVRSCLSNMGGTRPADLERDEFTWVDASDLREAGWSKHSAEGTFGALVQKGVVFPYGSNGEFVLQTAAWRWLDTIWDAWVADQEAPAGSVVLTLSTQEADFLKFQLNARKGMIQRDDPMICELIDRLTAAIKATN